MATIEEIAQAAGVSRVTVANILQGRNKENRPSAIRRAEQVRLLAAQMGYRPNAAARAVARGRHGGVALLSAESIHSGSPFRGTLHAILREARDRDLTLTLAQLSDAELTDEARLSSALSRLSADGLIVNYIQHAPPPLRELLRRFRLPTVYLNTRLESDCVYPDDFGAARGATEYLLKLGHERIAYVNTYPTAHYSSSDREGGYAEAMASAGRLPQFLIGPDYQKNQQPLLLGEWQDFLFERLHPSASERFTAAICYSADRAYTLYAAALRAGLCVPQDLSLVTFHDVPAEELGVTMTTSVIPAEEMGLRAVQWLRQKMGDGSLVIPASAVPHEWHPGATCAPPGTG